MRYSVTLPLKSHDKETPAQWARGHCKSYISSTWHLMEDEKLTKAEYHFSDNKDAFWFRMRWE